MRVLERYFTIFKTTPEILNVELHNKVNLLTHKNVNIRFDEVNKKYEQYRAICDSSNKLHVGCTTPQYKKLNGKTCEIKIISKK